MTWHQWHQTAPMSRRIGLSCDLACEKASSPHSYQSIGWCAAERRYGLAEFFRRFSVMAIGWLDSSRGCVQKASERLLEVLVGAEVARIERLAACVAFVLPVIITNAIFTKLPAQVDFLVIHDCRKIEQTNIEILDQTAGRKDFFQVRLHHFGEALLLHAFFRELCIRDQNAAHHQDARGNRGEILFEHVELLASADGFDQEGLELLACVLCLGERKQPLRR